MTNARRRGLRTLALLALLSGCNAQSQPEPRIIGLSSSLPLVWGESGDIRGQLSQADGKHWAYGVLERRGRVLPLDTLAGPNGLPLPSSALLVLAQPKPLSPAENVALDAWVRGGGRLLLFADPMLTAHSQFALGDPRRPEAIAMLSPILRHWGLDLQYDDEQQAGERLADVFGVAVPIDLAGRIGSDPGAQCKRSAGDVAVDCRIGKGRAIVIADAAVLDGEDAGRAATLDRIVGLID